MFEVVEFLPCLHPLAVHPVKVRLKALPGRKLGVSPNDVQAGARWLREIGVAFFVLRELAMGHPYPLIVQSWLQPRQDHLVERGHVPSHLRLGDLAVIRQNRRCVRGLEIRTLDESAHLANVAGKDLWLPRVVLPLGLGQVFAGNVLQ